MKITTAVRLPALRPASLVLSLGLALLAGSGALVGCSGGSGTVSLNGAGATFPYPLYSKWVAEYGRLNPNVRINYQSIGSGGGIRQITEKTVDFGASDSPMNDEALAKAPGLLHIPTVIGAVVVSYNVPELQSAGPLVFNPEVISAIFLGELTTWNDPRLVALNPGVTLPARPMTVVHRSDGSGTTAVFTDYLSAVSPAFKEKVGKGTSVSWPAGIGAKGNEGVTGQLKTTPGAIAYIEKAYARQSKLPIGKVINRAGLATEPTPEAMSAAAATATLPDDLRVSIVDAPGEKSYPITSFTYILVYRDNADAPRGETLGKFLWWAVHDGQTFAQELDYAPLPAPVVTLVEGKLRGLNAAGKAVLSGL